MRLSLEKVTSQLLAAAPDQMDHDLAWKMHSGYRPISVAAAALR